MGRLPGPEYGDRRLLLNFGRNLQQINREVINPVMDTVNLDDLEPVMRMVAHARGDYLKALFALAKETGGERAPEDVAELERARVVCDALIAAVGSLETLISRRYIDVGDDESETTAASA